MLGSDASAQRMYHAGTQALTTKKNTETLATLIAENMYPCADIRRRSARGRRVAEPVCPFLENRPPGRRMSHHTRRTRRPRLSGAMRRKTSVRRGSAGRRHAERKLCGFRAWAGRARRTLPVPAVPMRRLALRCNSYTALPWVAM
jgi:hypothetical protein